MGSSIPSIFTVSFFVHSFRPAYHIVLHYINFIDNVESLRLWSCRLQALEPQAIEPQARTIMTDCLFQKDTWFPLHVFTIPF